MYKGRSRQKKTLQLLARPGYEDGLIFKTLTTG
jgi:hypothetical protein